METEQLTTLLKTGGVLRLSAPTLQVFAAAEQLDFWRIAVNCTGVTSRGAMLTRLADTLQFPDHFGMNLDALYDCLTDQLLSQKKKGAVLILENSANIPNEVLAPVMDTLVDAENFLKMRGVNLSVVKA